MVSILKQGNLDFRVLILNRRELLGNKLSANANMGFERILLS